MMNSIKYFFVILILFFCIAPLSHGINENWDNTIILSDESTNFSYRANIVVDSNDTIHVVWKDQSDILNAGKDWDLFYKYKQKNGNWSNSYLVTTNSVNDSNCLSLAIDDENTLYLAWKDKTDMFNAGSDWDIFYKTKPLDNKWSETELISKNSTDHCSCPKITVDSLGTIHIVWADASINIDNDSDTDIMYVCKPQDSNWQSEKLLSVNSKNNTIDPALITDYQQTVHVVWYESILLENQDIVYSYKIKNKNWSIPEIVSINCTGVSSDPSLVVDSKNNLHLIWMDTTPLFENGYDYDVFYRVKKSNIWQDIELVSPTSNSNCKWPFLLIDKNDSLYASWADQTPYDDDSTGDYDIVLSTKMSGSAWSDIFLISDESRFDSNWPRYIIDSSDIMHMTWWDEQPSRYITYYDYGHTSTLISSDDAENESPGISLILLLISIIVIALNYKKNKKIRL